MVSVHALIDVIQKKQKGKNSRISLRLRRH